MNKIFKSALIAVVATMGLTMTSCVNKYEYDAASASGQQVYFDKVASKISLSKDATSFNVQVRRIATDEAATIALTSTDESGIFTIPGSAAFAAGENVATITIGYNPDVLEYDDFKPITLALADADNTTPYGDAKISFAAGIPSPFVTIGKAKFMDSWMYDDQTYFDVVLQQNEINPDIYRLVNPYDEILEEGGYSPNYVNKGPSEYLTFQLRHPGEEIGGAILTRSNLVTFEPFRTGYYISNYDSGDADGEVWGFHVSDDMFHSSWHVEAAYLKSYVAAYQEDGTPGQINLAPWYYIPGVGGWNKSQEDKQIEILFPGFTPADYSAEMVYSGIFTDAAGSVFAVANLTLGADAETVKAVVVEGTADAAAVADAIASGDLEATDVKGGRIEVPIPDDLTGAIQIIVVVLDGENVKNVVAVPFEYYGGGKNPWQSLGTGYLTDDFVVTMFYETYDEATETGTVYEPKTYEVEILENTDEPGAYRIVDAFKGVTSYLKSLTYESANLDVNATNPDAVYIETQSTGLFDGSDEIAIASYGGYSGNVNYMGKLVDGVITFPVLQTKSGTIFQGIVFFGTSGYYTGSNGAFKIVLPSASAGVKAKAKRAAAAADFEHRLNGGNVHRVKGVHVKKSSLQNRFSERPQTLKK